MKSAGGSMTYSSLHIGTDWRVYCHTYEDRTPILSVNAGPSSVSFSLSDRNADEAAVQFAQALARQAQVFAAEVERLHTEQTGAGDGDSDGKAADVSAA